MAMVVPTSLSTANQLSLFSEDGRSLAISITTAAPVLGISEEELLLRRRIFRILDPSYQNSKLDFLALFVPDIPFQNLHDWLCLYGGREPGLETARELDTINPAGKKSFVKKQPQGILVS